ncbi:hypothetical protein HAX54_023973 [Datura stramonium]|uniref:phosphoserine phosphatase n=1 Tax=Datura stramonium TaxID=4076 RepID=A0ABS8S519_DATST|nr:hypothetical protein [Datura stramonium]
MEGLMSFQANSVPDVSRQQSSPLKASAVAPLWTTLLPSKEVLDVWQNANAVCFDVDSTVCIDEGIDEFAEFCGAGEAVAEWTARSIGLLRLSLINPSLSQLQDFLKRPPRLSPGIDLLVKKLKDKNKDVYLVSGGFRQMINPVASILGIPLENIFANQILFGSNGEFAGFDKNEPTSRRGGKATAVQQIRKAHGYKSLVMIGDGATDLEARMPGGADLFICYGGVQLRESVAAKADWLKPKVHIDWKLRARSTLSLLFLSALHILPVISFPCSIFPLLLSEDPIVTFKPNVVHTSWQHHPVNFCSTVSSSSMGSSPLHRS